MTPLPAVRVARAPGTAGRRPAVVRSEPFPAAIVWAAGARGASRTGRLTRPGGHRPPGCAPPGAAGDGLRHPGGAGRRPDGVKQPAGMTLGERIAANFAVRTTWDQRS